MFDVSPFCPKSASRAHVWSNAEVIDRNGVSYSEVTCINCKILSRIKVK